MLKFSSKPVAEHAEVPLADEGRLEEIVAHWSTRGAAAALDADATGKPCYVASVGAERDTRARDAQLAEIVSLVESQGDRVVGREICHLAAPNPRTLLGRGAAEEIAARARAAGATMLVLDAELSPSQTRNLEDVAGIPICDREAVILNVFLRHARTRRARIQVEIAQLEYLRPRIRGVGLDMDQQTGGMSRARGPGETASELLARKLDGRLEELSKALRKIGTSSRTQRARRDACKRAVLVGYTNAGKTSLMNALTAAGLSARDVPFETLDTTSRCLTRHGGDVLLSDTVGVIRRLPPRLLASFESTLTEIHDATLLVFVVDVGDHERALHVDETRALVDRMGAGDVPRLFVFNKADRLVVPPSTRELDRLAGGDPWVLVSSRDPAATAALEHAILRAARAGEEDVEIVVPYGAARALALVYARCRVVGSDATDEGLRLRVQAAPAVLEQVRARLEEATQ